MVGDVKKLELKQETYVSNRDGKAYTGYYTHVMLEGQSKVNLEIKGGKDIGDVLFKSGNPVLLTVEPSSFTDEKKGSLVSFNKISASVTGSTGQVFTADLKPKWDGDKAKINMFMKL